MKIQCFRCGKPVSTEIPDSTVFRAVAECPECAEGHGNDEARADRERLRGEIAQAGKIIARFCDEECPVNTDEFGGHLHNPQDCERGCPCIGRDIWRVFTTGTAASAAIAEKEPS